MNYKEHFKKSNGLSVSTANYRLLRLIIFNMAKELNRHLCYRCNQPTLLSDFSIEHKNPWAWKDNSLEIFMDYENIAISHVNCNSGNIRQTKRRDKVQLDRRRFKDDKWRCSRCSEWKTEEHFHNNKTNISKKESMCKLCRKKYSKYT